MRFALSDTCYLRPLEDSDADELHGLIEANRAYLSRWMLWPAGQTPEDTLAFIQRTRKQLIDNDGFQVAIVREGGIVGVAGFHSVDWNQRSTSIGYWLAEEHQGQGTMTQTVRALVDHALSVWQLNRVEIRVAESNQRSRGIPERLGFRQEGTLRQAQRVGKRYHDLVVYSVLAPEWRSGGSSRADE